MDCVLVKPKWLTIRPSYETDFSNIRAILKSNNLTTVCQHAHCPNMAECWNHNTATFMVMGDTCTRACKFCATKTCANPEPLDKSEPEKLATAVSEMGLKYVVITSVDRDDLRDKGSNHFAACILAIKNACSAAIEVLIPDYVGELLQRVTSSHPNVIAHNIETVKRLQRTVRDPRASYNKSLKVLSQVKLANPNIFTKSSIMVGLGESNEEVIESMKDLRNVGCDIITLGQYLKPKNKLLEVKDYVTPKTFNYYQKMALELGFSYCASGPFVRSSYKAGHYYAKMLEGKNAN